MFVKADCGASCLFLAQFCSLFNVLMKEEWRRPKALSFSTSLSFTKLFYLFKNFIILLYLDRKNNVPERLEVDPSKRTAVDLANIVPRQSAKEGPMEASRPAPPPAEDHFSEGFVDDPDVPPLI